MRVTYQLIVAVQLPESPDEACDCSVLTCSHEHAPQLKGS
jgi:hypothetical protein